MRTEEAKAKFRKVWEDNPVEVIAASATALTAAAKVIEMIVSARNSRTWKKEVDRRVGMKHYSKK